MGMRFVLLVLPTLLGADAAPLLSAEGLTCVSWTQQTVSTAYGYDHVVSLRNECATRARCSVTTDVAPTPVQVTLTPGAARDLVTFRGSPASAFSARVQCRE
jgi:hypothetical protein